ncbi:MAG: peptidoglycan DD-metalloendopeptidase family protein [Xanthomonadales bacterium]|jgi:septal ring factor EnvC (AmiA/AmiB activator)|nr:peptidoglycan DD-metalloendopeptidase family protein [Xanthomonadales bacterium]
MTARANKAALVLFTLVTAFGAAAQESDRPERERAEARLQDVLEEIASLQQEIQDSRQEHRKEQEQLRQLDLAMQQVNLRYRVLEAEKQSHEEELQILERQREDYLASLDQRLAQLAEQVRLTYRSGRQSRTRLVLNQDDPGKIGRMLAYYDYINRAQVEKIAGLREALTRLESLQQPIDAELARIAGLQQEQQEILAQLEQQRASRSELLLHIAGRIDDRESALKEREQNRRDLQALIEKLADVLADIPDDLESHTGVAGQKGRLPMPIEGPVRHAFGQDRGSELNWQGWLIGADAGAEVKAVAYGRVAFADWLRGYGLLIIIDHGDGYMTLYGHNESLLHDAGNWVDAGEIISVVGSNPGSGQGLYFELRRNGKAVDPAAWLAR